MIDTEILKQVGIDYDAVLDRFMNDKELYNLVLTAFAEENIIDRARDMYHSGNINGLIEVAHEAKGSSGNAGFDTLYKKTSELVALLRSKSYTDNELACSFEQFVSEYSRVHDGVRKALGL